MKRLLVMLLLLTSLYCQALTYVDVRLNVAEQGGTKPSTCTGIAYITRDATNNPMHSVLRVEGAYNSTQGYISWILPDGCYAKFEVRYVGLYDTFHITDDGDQIIYLNDLIPALPPPPPNWATQYFVPYTGANSNVNLGNYNLTANIGTFQSVVTPAVSLGGVDLGTTLSGLVPYTGAMANLDLGTFGLTTNSFKLSQAPNSDWILVSDNLGNGTWQNHKTAQWADMTDITDYTFFGSNSKPLKITGGVNIIGRTYEMRIGNEESGPRDVNTYRLVLSAEDNGFYGYSGAMVWEARPQGGGDIRQAKMRWFRNNGFGLQISDSINGYAHYFFKSDGLYLEDGLFWNSNNDGSGSGLDADLLDGNESSYYEKALTFSSPLSRTVDTVSITQSSATTDGYLSSADWNTFNSKVSTEEDGIIGNEIIGALDTTLTRHGQGTAANPFKLALTLSNPNVWTANQTAPNFLSSQTYDPNAPVSPTFPSGYPNNGSGADPKNDEFNGSATQTYANYGTGDNITANFTAMPGYMQITDGNAPYYMVDLGANKLTGDFDVTMHIGDSIFGADVGLALATDGSEAGGIHTYVMSTRWDGVMLQNRKSAKNVGWVLQDTTAVNLYVKFNYLRIVRVNGEITMYMSADGLTWIQTNMRDVSTSTNVYYIAESSPIQYYGVYCYFNSISSVHPAPGTRYAVVDWIRWK